MAKQLMGHRFCGVSDELLSDFLVDLNKRNRDHISQLSKYQSDFRETRVVESIFLVTEELHLDPLVGFSAIELFQRFMVKHLWDLVASLAPRDAQTPRQDALFAKIREQFPVIVFSCVQLASKLSLYSDIITNRTAVHFLHSVGLSVSKQTVFETEMTILKVLDFRLNSLNPLTYTEVLLEVLGHNDPSVPVDGLYRVCHDVLRLLSLDRAAIFDTLLRTTTRTNSPSAEQREKFVTVTEDFMLLGVAVIAAASYVHSARRWKKVEGELSHITGISTRSIRDFAHVILMHIIRPSSPVTATVTQ